MDFTPTISLALADDIKELFENLDDSSFEACRSLAALRRDLKLIIRSSVGFTLVLGGNQPVTLTSVDYFVRSHDIATSLWVPLSWLGPEEVGSSIVFYAGVSGALVDLAADLAYELGVPLENLRLDQHLTPGLLESGIVGLVEASTVNHAIGALIDRGHTTETAQAELERHAGQAHESVYHSATRLLLAVSGHGSTATPPAPEPPGRTHVPAGRTGGHEGRRSRGRYIVRSTQQI